MGLSMHEIALPVFRQQYGALEEILDQTRSHAEGRELDPAIYLATRLSPDMFMQPRLSMSKARQIP